MLRYLSVFALLACCFGATVTNAPHASQTLQWRVLRALPHDTGHYTQGLVLHGDRMIESAGRYGRSALYVKSIDDGRVLRHAAHPRNWFAEGVTVWRDRIVLLTWREHIAQWFDLALQPLYRHAYAGEGWGLTHDGRHLIMSDGSDHLQFRSPDDFSLVRSLRTTDRGTPVPLLNELEYARGLVFANVWRTDRIVAIDPASGSVRAWIDLAALKQGFSRPTGWDAQEHVLNGIAYDAKTDSFYVTGKCWPVLFELDVAHEAAGDDRHAIAP